ncbi:MAG: 2-succinyl-5-enolpyruvyl-6-hydroxy-3-cyclohexene-1-carboxylic-acid synthase [Myxococcaceae bacterium]|nr:2-succinyl-5-enolpyruvyl-6-hydroxy-3-cyclohexene-1-carboxylic-acid synthase [Myxococcaceae bacterium]
MLKTLNQRWSAAIVETWLAQGLQHAVICPGSRSTPLAFALAQQQGLRCWSHIDERSAAFFALGLSKASGVPTVVLCTSGSAGAHFLPAAIEAFHGNVPLILVTADRPWELQGFGAPQTMEQSNLYGRFVRAAEGLATPEDTPAMFAHVRAVAARAFAVAANAPRGPVHVNAPFREPLAPVAAAPAMAVSKIARISGARLRVADEAIERVAKAVDRCERGLIVVGPRAPDAAFGEAVHALGSKLGFPVLAEAASNVRFGSEQALAHYDAMLRHAPFAKAHVPQVILRFGGGLTSKAPQAWFDHSGARIFTFSDEGAYIDPQHASEELLLGEGAETCRALLGRVKQASPNTYFASWQKAHDRVRQALHVLPALSEPWVAQTVAASLPENSQLMVSSSMPVRDLDAFASTAKPGLKIFTNRALNGIDGVVSTALGVSAGSKVPTFLLIGDVAMLHDLGGWAAARRLGAGLNVIIVNNDGGGIFHFLPVAHAGGPFEAFFGTPHGTDFAHVAALGSASYHRVESPAQLGPALHFMSGERRLIEIRTNRHENVKVHAQLFEAAARALGDGPWL